jgi:hypothetical protein
MGLSNTMTAIQKTAAAAHAEKDPSTIRLVDGKTLASAMAISPRTLHRLRRRRSIPFHKIGRLVRYSPAAVASALAGYEVRSLGDLRSGK